MKLRQSISHPELLIDEDGTIYKDGQRLSVNKNHSTTLRGPLVCYWYEGKIKQLSVLRLVYEAHIKKAKIETSDFIDFYDGDEMNVHASNLFTGRRYSKPIQRKSRKKESVEVYECWMGIDEVYC